MAVATTGITPQAEFLPRIMPDEIFDAITEEATARGYGIERAGFPPCCGLEEGFSICTWSFLADDSPDDLCGNYELRHEYMLAWAKAMLDRIEPLTGYRPLPLSNTECGRAQYDLLEMRWEYPVRIRFKDGGC